MIGTLSTFIQGQGEVSADQLNTFIMAGYSDTQLLTTIGKTGMVVASQGTTAPGTSTLRFYYWNDTATGGGDNIVPTGATHGAWVKFTLA